MKIVVIGCTHAGTAAILNMARLYPEAQITVYERNDNISFLSCGIALYVGGVVKDAHNLFYCSPEKLADLGVNTRMRHDVLNVDSTAKRIQVKNLESGEVFEDHFDKLILTTGSWPILPNIEGIRHEKILLSKNYQHSNAIIDAAQSAKRIAVVGAGYIGVELVEAFEQNGKEVVLIDAHQRIMSRYLDPEFTNLAEDAFKAHGVKLALGECVESFREIEDGSLVIKTSGGEYNADLVILCIGFKPNTELVKGQVDMLPNGAIIVDDYMRTSNPDILAAGDSCAVRFNPTGKPMYMPLATNAVRMGTLVARNLLEPTTAYMGTQGTSGIKIYEHNIASTGLTLETAIAEGLDAEAVTLKENHRPEFMPTYHEVHVKIVFEKGSRRVLGAQLASTADLTQSINTLSVVIQNRMTVDDLAFVDFFFQPHYNKPWNFLNAAGLMA